MRILFMAKRPERFILLIIIVIAGHIFAAGFAQGSRADQVFYWDKVLVAYNAYVGYPSPENAKALLATLPIDRPDEEVGDISRALDSIFSVDSFPILYEEAITGDRISIEIMFRLLNVSDGYFSELVLSTLGTIIRDKPQLFLDVLIAYKDTKHVRTCGYPVWFSGAGYNIHPGANRYNLEKRIEALETVRDPKYAEIKEACIKRLKEIIKKLPL